MTMPRVEAERIKSEFEKIAFAPVSAEVKAADKLRALDLYAKFIEACTDADCSGDPLVVVYDYGGENGG